MSRLSFLPARLLLSLLSVVIISLMVGVWWINRSLFVIKTIDCQLDDQPCDQELLSRLDFVKQTTLFFTDHRHLIETNLSQPGQYTVVSLRRKLPSTLILELKRQPQVYAVELPPVNDQQQLYVVRQTGQLTKLDQLTADLTVIHFQTSADSFLTTRDQSLALNGELHTFFSDLLTAVAEEHVEVSTYTFISPQELRLELPNDLIVLMSTENARTQVQRMKLILNGIDLKTVDIEIKVIDVRFKLPVLKTNLE